MDIKIWKFEANKMQKLVKKVNFLLQKLIIRFTKHSRFLNSKKVIELPRKMEFIIYLTTDNKWKSELNNIRKTKKYDYK